MNDLAEWSKIAFHDIAVKERDGWFCNIGYNALFHINIETGITTLVKFLPYEEAEKKELYAPIVYYKEKLYIAPRNGGYILQYDLKEEVFIKKKLDVQKYGGEDNYNLFNGTAIIDGKIYFFPGRFRAIVRIDEEDLSISYIDKWYEELAPSFFVHENGKFIFHQIHVDVDGCVLMPCWQSSKVVDMDLLSGTFNMIDCGAVSKDVAISDMVKIEGEYWFSLKDGAGIWCYKGDDRLYHVTAEQLGISYTGGCFLKVYKKWIYIIPFSGGAIVRYNVETKKQELIYEFPEQIDQKQKWLLYKNNVCCAKMIDEKTLLIYQNYNRKIILIDMNTSLTTELDICLNENVKSGFGRHAIVLADSKIVEKKEQCLRDFIYYVGDGISKYEAVER